MAIERVSFALVKYEILVQLHAATANFLDTLAPCIAKQQR